MTEILESLKGVTLEENTIEKLSSDIKNKINEEAERRASILAEERIKEIEVKADAYCDEKVKTLVESKVKELEELANDFCAEKCKEYEKSSLLKVESEVKKMETAAENYIKDYFDVEFEKKYGSELQKIEESAISSLDKYLNYSISQKISPKLIESAAVSETYAPIIAGIKQLFESQYVKLDTSGMKKVNSYKKKLSETEEKLAEKINENIELNSTIDAVSRKALIAEKCQGLSLQESKQVKMFFEGKSFSSVKKDIDSYVEMISESHVEMKKPIVERQETAPQTQKVISEKKVVGSHPIKKVLQEREIKRVERPQGVRNLEESRFERPVAKKVNESKSADDFLLTSTENLL